MDEVLPLRFKWEPAREGLFLRTKMVFSLEQHRRDPVMRCHNHMAMPSKANAGADVNIMKYVVRCLETQSQYEEMPGGHLSILTPLGTPEVGSMYVPVHFKFLCKNSCTSGMNRRATELIFTLENGREVLGRRRLQVRICSCPKRDKEKEELEATGGQRPPSKKRKSEKMEPALPPISKRVSTTNEDTAVYNLNLDILGKEEAMAVKKFAYDIMAGKALRTGQMELYKPYLNKIFM